MTRFVVIFLFFMGIAPLVPFLMEYRLGVTAPDEPDEVALVDTGERIYRIARNRQGHFVADANLNGRAVEMLVDTGATVTVLPESVAEDIGIFLQTSDYKYQIRTANGTVRGAKASIDRIRLGNISLRDIDALVLPDESLGEPLLGMSVLNRLQRFDMSGGTLVLVQ
ncbi:retropepsin-like aspartic protease family protein [Roseibium sediminicola]|uniref:TIGR02281 family clan AA aspartic protease n=1 Tax=Roseibium sediminicola TaxID=2933272 RepID=A0ABT0GXA8_9HYPH|nr:TIGR02281 family clan AA aspartic protease [Roseibium sp. CAU 1639]MCK7614079.1 TIGR02281 family clan AA aspartic protease [Roseibium sp. CAU 1639]